MEREERRGTLVQKIGSDRSSTDDEPPELIDGEDIPVSEFAEVTVAQNDDSQGQRVQSVQTDKVDLYESSKQTIAEPLDCDSFSSTKYEYICRAFKVFHWLGEWCSF